MESKETLNNRPAVNIRPLAQEDAETSFKWRNDAEVWRHTISRPDREITVQDEYEWMNKVLGEKDSYRFAIEADSKYVGNIYLTDINDDEANYHIFIGDKACWGRGVARSASNLLIDFAKNLGLKKINLDVSKDNVVAIKLYNSLGFVLKETLDDSGIAHMELDLKD